MEVEKNLCFIVTKPPYKIEASKLALTHGISTQTADVYLEDDNVIKAAIAFVGDGVLNCVENQKSREHYGIVSITEHIKNSLLADVRILVCKEDFEKFGLSEEVIPNADDMGADMQVELVSFEDINQVMEDSDHLIFI
jgi:sulfur relay (sulfurtransferase) DsrF/TusC family protein